MSPSSSQEAPASVVAATDASSEPRDSSTDASAAPPQKRGNSLERTLELLEARLTEAPQQVLLSSPPVSNDATHSTASASSLTSSSRAAALSNLSTATADWHDKEEPEEVPTQKMDDDEDSNVTKKIHNHREQEAVVRESLPPPHSATKDKNKKRKAAIPVKVEVPSVKENTTVLGLKGGSAANPDAATTTTNSRKRTRSPLGDVAGAAASKSRTTTTSPLVAQHPHSNHSRSNPTSRTGATTTRSTKTAAAVPLKNNKRISDFFPRIGGGVASKKSNGGSLKSPSPPSSKAPSAPAAVSTVGTSTPGKMPFSSPTLAATEDSASLSSSSSAVERLRQRCLELERSCQDKDEQLRAVANNRSILHSSLQSALEQRQEQITQLQQEKQQLESKTASVLEELARNEATRQGMELRERLAADGARLGRLVYSRAGMRSVETWQEGHASKRLSQRRAQLKAKRLALERRQAAAKKACKQIQSRMETEAGNQQQQQLSDEGAPNKKEQTGDVPVVGGIPIQNKLDAMEAVESVRFHLSNVRSSEKELALEEQTLHDEKTNHIRALKRVASEDSSRFRSRPKLHDRYVLKSLLGKGGFSEVWQAYDLVELREVAVKIHQLDPRWPDAKKENYTKHVSREYEIHRNVRHPRIVSLFDVFEIDNNSFATVLELCGGTDLDSLLKQKKRLPERDARAILLQILLGMQYLSYPSEDGSRQGIIHYDLKPGNILFDEHGDAKITDFGLSKIIDTLDPEHDSMELTSQGAGTYWYLPPECFVEDKSIRISNKVDVFSIGVIFYQMLFGRRPFGDGQSQDKILSDRTMLNAHQVTFPDKPNVSYDGKEFIRACLTYDQAFRPTIAQVCQHNYVLSKQL